MANAKKCDRCGKCYDPASIEDNPAMITRFSNPIFQTAEDYKNNKITTCFSAKDRHDGSGDIDLCPECTGEFTLFMDGCPLKISKNDFDKPDIKENWNDAEVTDEEDKEYQKTAFQKFLDKVDQLGNEFFNDLES